MKHGRNAPFKKVANGVPGLEVRTALLFSEAVGKGRIDLPTFVAASPRDPSQLMPSRRGNRAGRTMLLKGVLPICSLCSQASCFCYTSY